MNKIGGERSPPSVIINLSARLVSFLVRMESEEPRLSLYYGVGSYLVIGAPLEEPPA